MSLLSWHRRPLVGFDVETTGIDPETARIVSASVARFGGGRDTVTRMWLSNAGGVDIPAGATRVHGYTTEAVREAGRPAAQVIEEIIRALADAVRAGLPLVVMQAAFDLTLLDREARRWGIRPLTARVAPCVLDPMVLDRQVDRYRRGRRRLTDLCHRYGVHLANPHTADGDAIAACAVTWKIADEYRWLTRLTPAHLHAEQVRWASDQAERMRARFLQAPTLRHRAANVRADWPLVPAPVAVQQPPAGPAGRTRAPAKSGEQR